MPLTVDSHVHIWTEDRKRYPRADTPYPASPELLLEEMERAGVDRAVIVLPMYYGFDNRLLADTFRRFPGRFAGVGVVDPRGPEAADQLTRLSQEHGIGGVRLRATIEETWFCQPETEPLWCRAADLQLPVCLQARPRHLSLIDYMVTRFPETPVVIDHFVHVPVAEGPAGAAMQTLLGLARLPKVTLKLSALYRWAGTYPFTAVQPLIRAAFAAFGAERMMWGSDWPHVSHGGGYAQSIEFVRTELPWLTADDRELLLGGTALRLWQFR
jgi:predicted TIM-barrel fold metal-dependent hydrolase